MSEQPVNTGNNRQPGTFTKGDPRINRKGRPRSFEAWRKLAKAILSEVAIDNKGETVVINGHIATNIEQIARSWLKNPKLQPALVEAAYGKVPQPIEHTGADGGAINVTLVKDD